MTSEVLDKLAIIFIRKWKELDQSASLLFSGRLSWSDLEKYAHNERCLREEYFKSIDCEIVGPMGSFSFPKTEGYVTFKWCCERVPSTGTPLRFMFVKMPIDLAEKTLVLGCLP